MLRKKVTWRDYILETSKFTGCYPENVPNLLLSFGLYDIVTLYLAENSRGAKIPKSDKQFKEALNVSRNNRRIRKVRMSLREGKYVKITIFVDFQW